MLAGWCEETRQWRTSAAKAYPERFCQAIASEVCALASRIQTAGVEPEVPGLEEAMRMLNRWDPYLVGNADAMTSDYHPQLQGTDVAA